jgi:transposase
MPRATSCVVRRRQKCFCQKSLVRNHGRASAIGTPNRCLNGVHEPRGSETFRETLTTAIQSITKMLDEAVSPACSQRSRGPVTNVTCAVRGCNFRGPSDYPRRTNVRGGNGGLAHCNGRRNSAHIVTTGWRPMAPPFRRIIATRYDKTARNFLAAVQLVASVVWLN